MEQCWAVYIHMFHLYLRFSINIKTGGFQLFVNSIPQLGVYCIKTSSSWNYPRWLVFFHDKLVEINSKSLTLKEFADLHFTINRTKKK